MLAEQPGQESERTTVIDPTGPVISSLVPHGHWEYLDGPTAAIVESELQYVPPQPIGLPL